MGRVLTLEEAIKASHKLKRQGKTTVLVGGCFDILHKGHFVFLKQAKKQGDILFVALENDENVARLKGSNRPINPQQKRAQALTASDTVDYIILLPTLRTDEEYFSLTQNFSPTIIAVTEGDPKRKQKEEQAKAVGGKVVAVTKRITQYSTTKLVA